MIDKESSEMSCHTKQAQFAWIIHQIHGHLLREYRESTLRLFIVSEGSTISGYFGMIVINFYDHLIHRVILMQNQTWALIYV